MNAALHFFAVVFLGLLVWMWSKEKSNSKFLGELIRIFTHRRHCLVQQTRPQGKVYLARPDQFIPKFCCALTIPLTYDKSGSKALPNQKIDKTPQAANSLQKIDPGPLLDLVLLDMAVKFNLDLDNINNPLLTVYLEPRASKESLAKEQMNQNPNKPSHYDALRESIENSLGNSLAVRILYEPGL
jgi:hypothetical protein